MGNHQHAHAACGLLGQQECIEIFLQADVERGEWLVEQQQVGLQYQRPGQRYTTLHAAGELVRELVEVARRQPQAQRQRTGLSQALAPTAATSLESQRDVVDGGLPWQQPRVLEHARRVVETVVDSPLLHVQQARAQV